VGSLGDVLTLLHDAAEQARPARLTLVEWSHGSRAQAAFQRFMTRHLSPTAGVLAVPTSSGSAPDETTSTTSLAFDGPTRYREDGAGAQAGVRYVVRDGDDWVMWDADWGATTSDSRESGPPASPYAFLLDPSGILGAFRLELAGATEVAGRPALHVRAFERPELEGTGAALLRVGAGADVVELAVDAERGALLRSEAFLDGEPFHRFEVTEIEFGPNPAATFELVLPEGAAGDDATRWARPEPLQLHELPAVAPFPVLAPERVPDGWRLITSLFTAGREHPPVEAQVFLGYASADGAYAVSIAERASGAPPTQERDWERDGDVERADDGEYVNPRHHVRVERGGTAVELSGADPGLLADFARALAPAPTEPPRL